MWDLAGHREFHALYDFMIPSRNNAATLFAFTYSPIISPIEDGAGGLKPMDRFKQELLYWLAMQFVASKSEPNIKPQVLVVITNKDRVLAHFKNRPRAYTAWEVGVQNTIATIVAQDEFSNVVDLNLDPFIVNIRGGSREDHAMVKKWMDANVTALQETLSRLEQVPTLCDEVGRAMSVPQTCPIITKQEFFNICAAKLRKLPEQKKRPAPVFTRTRESTTQQQQLDVAPLNLSQQEELQLEAVAACLHHSGEIIYDKDLHFIVRNPRWFGFGILGHLLDLFAQDANGGYTDHLPKFGFMTKKALCRLLQQASQSVPGLDHQQVNSQLLVDNFIKIMICLYLFVLVLRTKARRPQQHRLLHTSYFC